MSPIAVFPADPEDVAFLERVAEHLERGGLLGYPTETVYGLGAAVTREGIASVRALKDRGWDKPFLVLVPDRAHVAGAGLEWSPQSRALASEFWPGPLTLVLRDPSRAYPDGVRSADGGVAVRVSSHPFVRALLEVRPAPLLSTSANRSGGQPARTATEVKGAVEGRPGIDRLWIVDGGALPGSAPSTVVDCTGPGARVIRLGRVPMGALADVLPEIRSPTEGEPR